MMTGTKFDIEKFDRKNDFALWQVLQEIANERTAAGIWKKLETLFMTKSLANHLYLKKKLYTFNMHPGKSHSEHINEFYKLVGDLVAIDTAILNEDHALLLLIYLPSELQKMTKAKGDDGEGFYVRKRSGQRDMKYNYKKSQGFVRNEDHVSGSGADGRVIPYNIQEITWLILKSMTVVYSRIKVKLDIAGTLEKEGFTVKMQSCKIKVIKGSLVVLSGTRRANYAYTLDGQVVTRKTLKEVYTTMYEEWGHQSFGCCSDTAAEWLVKEANVTLLAKVRCFLIQSGLSKVLWAEDTTMSTYLVNKVTIIFKTPIDITYWEQHSTHELFSYREDSNEAAFAVAKAEKVYAHDSFTFNNTVACEVISKWKDGLKDDMDVWSDVYVLSNGCRRSRDESHDYYWEYAPSKGNVLGVKIVRDQSDNTLRVSHSRFYNKKLVQTLLEGHSILSLEVRKFTTDNKCSIDFDPYGFTVQDYHTHQTLLRCDSTGDLYPLHIAASASALLTNNHSLWHQCLGHPGDVVIHTLSSCGLVSYNKQNTQHLCHAYQLGEALVSVYNRFAQLMNDLERNDMHFPIVTINTKFLNSLQPEWLKYVNQVRLAKRLTVDTFDDHFDYLQQFEKLVNTSRAKKLEKSHDPLALVAHTGSSSRNTSSYYVTHPTSVVDYNDEYQQDDIQTNPEDPLASAMNIQTSSSGNTSTVQCYNCSRKGHYARNCLKPRVRDSKYFMEQMLLAKQDEAGVILTDEHNDFLFADASRLEEIEDLSTSICLMAKIQPTNNTSDAGPSYDSAFISEGLQARIKILKKYVQRCEKKSVDFELKLQHEKEKHKWDSTLKNNNTKSLDYFWISKMEKLEHENVSLDFQVQSLIKECDNVKIKYQKLFDSIKKTRSQTQKEIDELIAYVSEKTYAYGAIRAKNQNLLFIIYEVKTRLKNIKKGKSVNTKFDTTNGSQTPICVTPINKHAFQKKTDVSKIEENHILSKPVTLQTSPDKQRGKNSNKNVIAPGMYKVVTTQESQTNKAKSDLSSMGMNAASSVRRSMNRDLHDKNSVLANSKNSAKKVAVITLSTNSRTPKSSDTTYVVLKTRFFKKLAQSKTFDTTFVVSKPKIDVGSASKAKNKVVQIVLWIVDSGCSKHMTGDRSLLRNFIEKFMGTVCFGNDNFAAITGYANYIQGNITICHVYYVEGLGHNLFSVGQFCDGDLEVAFRSKTCYVRNL
nr:zinc finger, CCHC-type [Tanacetum cinerariifolium]